MSLYFRIWTVLQGSNKQKVPSIFAFAEKQISKIWSILQKVRICHPEFTTVEYCVSFFNCTWLLENVKLSLFILFGCRGFLKSDKVLGTVNMKLSSLETKCTVHESIDVSTKSCYACRMITTFIDILLCLCTIVGLTEYDAVSWCQFFLLFLISA